MNISSLKTIGLPNVINVQELDWTGKVHTSNPIDKLQIGCKFLILNLVNVKTSIYEENKDGTLENIPVERDMVIIAFEDHHQTMIPVGELFCSWGIDHLPKGFCDNNDNPKTINSHASGFHNLTMEQRTERLSQGWITITDRVTNTIKMEKSGYYDDELEEYIEPKTYTLEKRTYAFQLL